MSANYTKTLREIYKSDTNEGELIRAIMDNFAEDLIDEVVSATVEVTRIVSSITRRTELRWQLISQRIHVYCPSCQAKVKSSCSRFECYICGEIAIIRSNKLKDICKECISYNNKCLGPDDPEHSDAVISFKGNAKEVFIKPPLGNIIIPTLESSSNKEDD